MRCAWITWSRATTVFTLTLIAPMAQASAKPSFTVYGAAQLDYIYDVHRVDPLWEDALRPSKIPTTEGLFGSNGQSLFSVKQSRLGVMGDIPVGRKLSDINFKFEFDMFGTGANAGQTNVRLRHAYVEWGELLAGQTNSTFMDGEAFPNVLDYWGPTGTVYLRNPQLRWTPYRTGDSNFAIAIEKPSNDIDIGNIRVLAPELGNSIQNDEKFPDLTAHYYSSSAWGHFQLAGILREVAYDTANTPNNAPKGRRLGWGVNASGHVNLFERDKLIGSVAYGEGIASYLNDGGTDLAPRVLASAGAPPQIKPAALPLLGIMAYFEHHWNNHWMTSGGYGMTQVDNTNLQSGSAYRRGEYASINLIFTPVKGVTLGGEFLWGKRSDFDGSSGNDPRIQLSARYDFSTPL
ncbi:MAG TPA: DcaP family trimeric outer membrane transporter [Rhizomicrobium sp.]|nr:DcaP family trimeric outer membrane transporter [Rhizomicrobium sp.]